MSTLSSELKSVIESRLKAASPREVLAIASALCDEEAGIPPAPRPIVNGIEPRFTVSGEVVYDAKTNLTWSRNTLAGKHNWAGAKKACEACRIGGFADWRLPTIQELLSLVDYERTPAPTIDPAFECESGWYWSSTPVASSPSDYAWSVYFSYGYSSWVSQGYEYFVRAVRPGQIVGSLA